MAMQKENTNILSASCAPTVRVSIADRLSSVDLCAFNSPEYVIIPGFCDVHVHFREPGFSYKETILSGSLAAARGGYTAVCTMPNLDPVPDSKQNLKQQLDLIRQDGLIRIYGSGTWRLHCRVHHAQSESGDGYESSFEGTAGYYQARRHNPYLPLRLYHYG